jgi:hypothetical protein
MKKFLLLLLLFAYHLLAQNSKVVVDTTSAQNDSTKITQSMETPEFLLETIRIEAVIEKPSVTIIPKKIETEVGELPFDRRSFERELNEVPSEVNDVGKEFEHGQKMENLKKSLAKDK